jgi:hypothetical protein
MPVTTPTHLHALSSPDEHESPRVLSVSTKPPAPTAKPVHVASMIIKPIHRFEVDAETGTLRVVTIDPHTGVATPLTTEVSVSDIMETIFGQPDPPPAMPDRPTLSYKVDETTQSIQVLFKDPKTGEVLHKLPEDNILKLNAIMREYAKEAFVNRSV